MVWEQGVSIIAMVTAEEVLWFHIYSATFFKIFIPHYNPD